MEVNTRLLEHLGKESHGVSALGEHLRQLDTRVGAVAREQESSFTNSTAFQFFVYTGVAAFVTGIASGVIFLINTFGG